MKAQSKYKFIFLKKEYPVSFAVIFWFFVLCAAIYVYGVYSAVSVIGWAGLSFLVICPFEFNGKGINPFPEWLTAVLYAIMMCLIGVNIYQTYFM